MSTPSREDLAAGNVDDGAGSSAWWWLHPVVADPTRPALLDSDGLQWSRQEVVDAVRAVAASLSARGVGRHDRLALVMPPGPELACALLGAMSTAVVAPLAPSSPVGNLADSFQRLHITGVLVDGDPPQAVAEAAARTGVAVIPLNPLRLSAADAPAPARPEPDDLALLLQTSGTTARPKVVPLTHANLQASTRWAAESMELGTDDRGLLAMPLHHISGIVTSLLAPLMAGGSVICCRSSGPDVLRNVLGGLHPTWFSAVPTLLQALLTQAERSVGSESHSLRFIRAAGSPLAPRLFDRLEAHFQVPVIEGYGMTEAYWICSNRLPGSGYSRKPGSVGPPAGPEVAVLGPHGSPQPRGLRGEVVIRGANVTAGYESAGQTGWIFDGRGERWFSTGDEGYLDPDGYLVLTGRLKEMINRGGEKVTPRRVDEAFLSHPAVDQAMAFALPHPTLGEDLAVAVVLRLGISADEEELRRHAFAELAPQEVPSRVLLLTELPRGETGKPQRIGMADRLANVLVASDEPADGELEHLIADTFAEVLHVDRPGRNANFFLCGGDSLSGQRVILRLGRALSMELSPELLFIHPTVRELAVRLDGLLDEALAELGETQPFEVR